MEIDHIRSVGYIISRTFYNGGGKFCRNRLTEKKRGAPDRVLDRNDTGDASVSTARKKVATKCCRCSHAAIETRAPHRIDGVMTSANTLTTHTRAHLYRRISSKLPRQSAGQSEFCRCSIRLPLRGRTRGAFGRTAVWQHPFPLKAEDEEGRCSRAA